MRTAGGYLDQRTASPVSLGAAIAINGALVGAVLLASPEVREIVPRSFIAKHVPLEKPKPVPPEKRPIETPRQPRSAQTLFQPPITPIVPIDLGTIRPYVPPVIDQPPGNGIEATPTLPPRTPVFVGTRLDPRYAGQMQPYYPPALQRRQIEGKVVVRVLIGPDGRVRDIQQVSASDPGFYRATADHALKRWRFQPATRDGVAVEAWRTMTVTFRLDEV